MKPVLHILWCITLGDSSPSISLPTVLMIKVESAKARSSSKTTPSLFAGEIGHNHVLHILLLCPLHAKYRLSHHCLGQYSLLR